MKKHRTWEWPEEIRDKEFPKLTREERNLYYRAWEDLKRRGTGTEHSVMRVKTAKANVDKSKRRHRKAKEYVPLSAFEETKLRAWIDDLDMRVTAGNKQIKELQEANTREVERRRVAERTAERLAKLVIYVVCEM